MWYQEVQNLWHWYDIPSRSHWDCHRLPIVLQNVKASAKRTSCCGSKFYCGLPYLQPKFVTSCKHSIEMDGKGTSWLQQSSCYFGLQISRTDLGSRHSTDWWQVWPSDPPSCVTRVVWRSIHKNNLRTHIERYQDRLRDCMWNTALAFSRCITISIRCFEIYLLK